MPVTRTASATRLSTMIRRVSDENTVTASRRWMKTTTLRISAEMPAQSLAGAGSRRRPLAAFLKPGKSCPVTAIGGLLLLEAVAHAIQRFDHLELVVDRLELLAEPLDVAVDGT